MLVKLPPQLQRVWHLVMVQQDCKACVQLACHSVHPKPKLVNDFHSESEFSPCCVGKELEAVRAPPVQADPYPLWRLHMTVLLMGCLHMASHSRSSKHHCLASLLASSKSPSPAALALAPTCIFPGLHSQQQLPI